MLVAPEHPSVAQADVALSEAWRLQTLLRATQQSCREAIARTWDSVGDTRRLADGVRTRLEASQRVLEASHRPR